MDIHKPKPWHGWREFLKEYATIVVGVLTALAAEQLVDTLHWRERTHAVDETLHENLSAASGPTQSAFVLAPCQREMLDDLERALRSPGDEWRPPFVIHAGSQSAVFVAPVYMLETELWRNAQADGTANHFPSQRQELYAAAYDRLAQLQASNNDVGSEIAELNSLSAPRHIDPESRTNYLRLIYRVRASIDVAQDRGELFIRAAKDLGVRVADPRTDEILKSFQQVCARLHSGQTDVTMN